MKKIAIINGPNLNLLGRRQPEIYGYATMEESLEKISSQFPECRFEYFQSNSEGDIIDRIQTLGYDADTIGIILNPGAYAHYSFAIADAVSAVPAPVIEIHISNIHAREEFRRTSVTAPYCRGIISGLGMDGYALAAKHLLNNS